MLINNVIFYYYFFRLLIRQLICIFILWYYFIIFLLILFLYLAFWGFRTCNLTLVWIVISFYTFQVSIFILNDILIILRSFFIYSEIQIWLINNAWKHKIYYFIYKLIRFLVINLIYLTDFTFRVDYEYFIFVDG